MSSSVSNPYTFNISKNTIFSTSVTAGVTFQITMKYESDGADEEWSNSLYASNLPLTIGKYTLIRVYTGTSATWGEGVSSVTHVVFHGLIPKTRIIINGGPFNNLTLTRDYYINNTTRYACDESYESDKWNNAQFKLVIIFMD